MKFAVIKVKKIDGVSHFNLDVIFESECVANGYCVFMNEHLSSVRISYIIKPLSSCIDVVESDLIKRCMNIANCLNLAEVCLMKNGSLSVGKSKYWFNVAKSRSKIAADLLEVL